MGISYSVGERGQRPWGSWEVIALGEGFVVKRIDVRPGERLSLQSHEHRSEHWMIIKGSAAVTLGDDMIALGQGGSILIPAKTRHRIHNTGQIDLLFLEVQTGAVLDENDIQRFDDEYGRV